MSQPKLYASYDRKAVHDLFEPETPFTPQTGKWGLPGIVRVSASPGDFVLFVTMGKQQGAHAFDESISDIGVLRWQSQPQQDFSSKTVIDLIAHDERVNTIHLFLRTSNRRNGSPPPYTYLGALRYREHDGEREQPVHIAWELLSWPIPADVCADMDLSIVAEGGFTAAEPAGVTPVASPLAGRLDEEAPPQPGPRRGESTRRFKAMKRRYMSSEASRDLGLKGEHLVLRRERIRLIAAGRADLAELVVHTSVIEGDGTGYDIRSFFPEGATKYIEVKTTTGPKDSEFYISPNEIAFSAAHPTAFELCRVFDYDDRNDRGKSYSAFGPVADRFVLTETQYRAAVR